MISDLAMYGSALSYTASAGLAYWYAQRWLKHPPRQSWRDMCQHIRIQGQPGAGKSTLILNLINAQIKAGRTVIVLDPHGPLARAAYRLDPSGVYHRPATKTMGMNVLHLATGTEAEKEMVVDATLSLVRSITSHWGSIQDATMERAIWNALERPNPTLQDVIDNLPDDDRGSVARLSKLVSTPTLRRMMMQPPVDIMGQSYYLDLSGCGERTTDIIYALHMIRVQQLAMKRNERSRGVFLCCDEAQRVSASAESLSRILAELRKYSVSVCLAHHTNAQLPGGVTKMYGLIGTQYLFRMTSEDARDAKEIVAPMEWERLANLPNYTCIRRRQTAGYPERAHIYKTPPPPRGAKNDDTPTNERRSDTHISSTTKGRNNESTQPTLFPVVPSDGTTNKGSGNRRPAETPPATDGRHMGVRVLPVRKREKADGPDDGR